jgi:hypothetical protein
MESTKAAELIRDSLKRLVQQWVEQVRSDPRIKSDAGLTTPELIDHVPAVIEEICDLAERGELPGIRNTSEARANVYTRLLQNYQARDLVRELSLLRLILIDYVETVSSGQAPGISGQERRDVARIINMYLDEEMRHAISVYTDIGRNAGPAGPSAVVH